jgi:hypothetical protein
MFIIQRKPQWLYKMQLSTGCNADTGDVSGVLGDLGLMKDNIDA